MNACKLVGLLLLLLWLYRHNKLSVPFYSSIINFFIFSVYEPLYIALLLVLLIFFY